MCVAASSSSSSLSPVFISLFFNIEIVLASVCLLKTYNGVYKLYFMHRGSLRTTRQFLLSRGGKRHGEKCCKIVWLYLSLRYIRKKNVSYRPYRPYRPSYSKQAFIGTDYCGLCVDCGGFCNLLWQGQTYNLSLVRWVVRSETTNDDQTDDNNNNNNKNIFFRGDIKYTEVVKSVQFSSPDCPDKIHNTYRRNVCF